MGLLLTKELQTHYLPLYNTPHSGPPTLTIDLFTVSDHFITAMVDIAPYGTWLLFISPSGAESYICLEYYFSSSDNKPQSG